MISQISQMQMLRPQFSLKMLTGLIQKNTTDVRISLSVPTELNTYLTSCGPLKG